MPAVSAPREANALNALQTVVLAAAIAVVLASVEATAPARLEIVLDAQMPVPNFAALAAKTAKTRKLDAFAPSGVNASIALKLVELAVANAVVLASVVEIAPAQLASASSAQTIAERELWRKALVALETLSFGLELSWLSLPELLLT